MRRTFILLTWMPTYYAQVLGLDLMKSGFFSVLPWCTMAVSANLGGWIADKLAARGTSITTVRKIMQSVGCHARTCLRAAEQTLGSMLVLVLSIPSGASTFMRRQ